MTTLSENLWTEQDLRREAGLLEAEIEYYETMLQRKREKLAAIQQELGTLPVKQSK